MPSRSSSTAQHAGNNDGDVVAELTVAVDDLRAAVPSWISEDR